jgi:hypothetical protein
MRANEIMDVPSGTAQVTLLKLRKGMAASLNASRFSELFPVLPGWQIEKDKQYRLSDGGWILSEIGGGAAKRFLNYGRRNKGDGHIHCETAMPRDVATYPDWGQGEEKQKALRDDDEIKLNDFKTLVSYLESIQNKPQGNKWMVKNVNYGVVNVAEYGNAQFAHVSFELYAMTSGFKITSPDGQTYEVYGDYKNGAISPHTFETFFHWAVENTDIMDQINSALQMEPHEKKIDPSKPYTPPPTASAETKLVFDFLKTMTDDVRAEQKVNYIKESTNGIERFVDAVKARDEKRAKALAGGRNGYIIGRVWDSKLKAPRPDWEQQVEEHAEYAVEAMQNTFVFKNTRKLASIMTGKGSVGNHKIIDIDTRSGIITASIRFSFDDGSAFTVHQSIVASSTRDSWGRVTDFYRFPTTFHDVLLPGGSKMGMPSEERMNEIFTKA